MENARKVLRKINSIICLQETNWMKEKETFGSVRAQGVTILLKENCINDMKLIHGDKNGRMLFIVFDFCGEQFQLIYLYAPN